jgi:hypothetical protein
MEQSPDTDPRVEAVLMVSIPYSTEQWKKIEEAYEIETGDLGARYRNGQKHRVRVVAAWWANWSSECCDCAEGSTAGEGRS